MTTPTSSVTATQELPKEHFQIVFVGHVDHGKSTLLGRIYADTGSLPDGHVEKVQDICKKQGKQFEYAFLFDAFLEEQEQGITIDTARTFFEWKNREYIIIDAPGHKEFLKNMISGAARAEAAILIIDAHEGVREQSKRHGYMLKLLGIRQVSVVVNKIDMVDFSEQVFRDIEIEYRAFLSDLEVEPVHVVPASAREGDNVVNRSEKLAWFEGPTVLECLENFKKLPGRPDLPLRFPVQDVYKFDDRRIIAGRVASGEVVVGDRLVFFPSNKSAVVKTIEAFNVAEPPNSIGAGCSTGFTLDEQIFVERGEIAARADQPPAVAERFKANVFWMGNAPLQTGRSYFLRLATREVEMQVEEVHSIIDASTLGRADATASIAKNDVAEVTLRTKHPISLDSYTGFDITGRFVIVDGYDVCGGGIITDPMEIAEEAFRQEARWRDIAWRKGEVKLSERVQRNGHAPGIVLFTGAQLTGKAKLARRLERKLFAGGKQVYLLDGKNLQVGLDIDLDENDKQEMVRRFGEVAQILLRAGQMVVSTTNTFALADHQIIRELVHPHQVVTVHMSFEKETPPDNTDLTFLTDEDLDEAVARVLETMDEKGIVL